MDKDKAATGPLTNVQRLRAHLTKNGLAAALLSAWEANDPPDAQRRLLAALRDFHNTEQPSNGPATA